jgi:hypothetical protein
LSVFKEDEVNELYTSDQIKVMFKELFEEIKHGDREHREWLRDKIKSFVETKLPTGLYKIQFGSCEPEK